MAVKKSLYLVKINYSKVFSFKQVGHPKISIYGSVSTATLYLTNSRFFFACCNLKSGTKKLRFVHNSKLYNTQ
jgi:hypothetical protein